MHARCGVTCMRVYMCTCGVFNPITWPWPERRTLTLRMRLCVRSRAEGEERSKKKKTAVRAPTMQFGRFHGLLLWFFFLNIYKARPRWLREINPELWLCNLTMHFSSTADTRPRPEQPHNEHRLQFQLLSARGLLRYLRTRHRKRAGTRRALR